MEELLNSYCEMKAKLDRRAEELKSMLDSCEGNMSAHSIQKRINVLKQESDELAFTIADIRSRL